MQNNKRSIMQINCNFMFSIILESLNSFKSSNLLEANRLTNTQVSKTVTDRIRITCVNSPENNYQVFIVHVAFPICCFCHSNDFF
jgi:hypothetical protein